MNVNALVAELQKDNEFLKEQVYSARITRRQQVAETMIRAGYQPDDAIVAAEKICTFIEGRSIPTAKTTKITKKKRKVNPHRFKAIIDGSDKKKRKYTKRSKFWKKK